MYYYPLLKNANNEMKALKNLKVESRKKLIPIIESKRVKKENKLSWETTFKTLGKYLKERVMDMQFIYDFNCAFEELGETEPLLSSDGENLVEHCIKKMKEEGLNLIPCFQHDSPDWLITSILLSEYPEIAIRVRCHDFQESFNPFVVEKLKSDLMNLQQDKKITLILDFFDQEATVKRIQNTIDVFSKLSATKLVYLATACPDNANDANPHSLTQVGSRDEFNNYIELKKNNPSLLFGDYTTRLKGEILKGFNHYNSYIKIFYTTKTHYWIAKSKLVGDDGEFSFHEICTELIEQDFYSGKNFSFGDSEIFKCAKQEITIGDHQSPIAIAVNHHIEITISQLINSPVLSSF